MEIDYFSQFNSAIIDANWDLAIELLCWLNLDNQSVNIIKFIEKLHKILHLENKIFDSKTKVL